MQFDYKDYSFDNAVETLFVHDSCDSGVQDDELRKAVADYIDILIGIEEHHNLTAFDIWSSRFVRERLLTEKRITEGYSIYDVREFMDWLESMFGVPL